jgi:hypothetical protein
MAPRLRRILGGSVAVAVLGTAAIGLMHTKPFRSWLMAVGGCPVAGDVDATAAQREATRQQALKAGRGTAPAPATAFYGLKLGTMPRGEVEAKVGSQASCKANTADLVLECTFASLEQFGVPSAGTAFFRFNAEQRLVAWVLMARRMELEPALQAFNGFSNTFTQALGAPHQTSGEATQAYLLAGAMRQARQELHFSDLLTKVVATNMGDGVLVIAEAQWLPEQLASL